MFATMEDKVVFEYLLVHVFFFLMEAVAVVHSAIAPLTVDAICYYVHPVELLATVVAHLVFALPRVCLKLASFDPLVGTLRGLAAAAPVSDLCSAMLAGFTSRIHGLHHGQQFLSSSASAGLALFSGASSAIDLACFRAARAGGIDLADLVASALWCPASLTRFLVRESRLGSPVLTHAYQAMLDKCTGDVSYFVDAHFAAGTNFFALMDSVGSPECITVRCYFSVSLRDATLSMIVEAFVQPEHIYAVSTCIYFSVSVHSSSTTRGYSPTLTAFNMTWALLFPEFKGHPTLPMTYHPCADLDHPDGAETTNAFFTPGLGRDHHGTMPIPGPVAEVEPHIMPRFLGKPKPDYESVFCSAFSPTLARFELLQDECESDSCTDTESAADDDEELAMDGADLGADFSAIGWTAAADDISAAVCPTRAATTNEVDLATLDWVAPIIEPAAVASNSVDSASTTFTLAASDAASIIKPVDSGTVVDAADACDLGVAPPVLPGLDMSLLETPKDCVSGDHDTVQVDAPLQPPTVPTAPFAPLRIGSTSELDLTALINTFDAPLPIAVSERVAAAVARNTLAETRPIATHGEPRAMIAGIESYAITGAAAQVQTVATVFAANDAAPAPALDPAHLVRSSMVEFASTPTASSSALPVNPASPARPSDFPAQARASDDGASPSVADTSSVRYSTGSRAKKSSSAPVRALKGVLNLLGFRSRGVKHGVVPEASSSSEVVSVKSKHTAASFVKVFRSGRESDVVVMPTGLA
ncbi:hypothetical protein H9P43_002152 [Blastocladiella emersonii ATCC 22665]|nr:hypothetical protein H9P43_002152 [Blastocladiella emersonii ATCC 22665]